MKDLFPGYYSKTQEELKEIWETAYFCFDTNCLLNLYRYSENSVNNWFEVLSKLESKLKLPYQVAAEYQRNRRTVINSEKKSLNNSISEFEKETEKVTSKYQGDRRLSEGEKSSITEELKKVEAKYKEIINQHLENLPDYISSDSVRERLDNLYSGKVLTAFDPSKLKEIEKEGEVRFKNCFPPGFKDVNKDRSSNSEGIKDPMAKYGDLVLWKELIKLSKQEKKPIVFITDDRKDDWWLTESGEIVSEHPYLIQEFEKETKQKIKMYRPDQFLKYSKNYFGEVAKEETISEAKEVTQNNEEKRAKMEALEMLRNKYIHGTEIDTTDLFNSAGSNEEYYKYMRQIYGKDYDEIRKKALEKIIEDSVVTDNFFKTLERFNIHKRTKKEDNDDKS